MTQSRGIAARIIDLSPASRAWRNALRPARTRDPHMTQIGGVTALTALIVASSSAPRSSHDASAPPQQERLP